MPKFLCLAMSLWLSTLANAHEGHDHGPSTIPVQKGGVMRSLETVNLELVYKDGKIAIYPFEPKLNPKKPGKLTPAQPSTFPAEMTIELPKQPAQPLTLALVEDHWEAAFDPKSAHRFTVSLKITQGGHNDVVKWTIEPKK